MEQVRLTVHHSNSNSERSQRTIPAESSVQWHQVPLDDTLMATADDFFLFVLVLAVELVLGAGLDDELMIDEVFAVSCPKVSAETTKPAMEKVMKCDACDGWRGRA